MQAGVRSLSRNLAAICRHVAVQIVSEQDNQQPTPSHSTDADEDQSEAVEARQQPALHPLTRPDALQHHSQEQLSAHQQHEQQTESGSSPVEPGVQLPATGFSLGSLWGSLKGALKPPAHSSPSRRRHHSDHFGHHNAHHSRQRHGGHSGGRGDLSEYQEALASQLASHSDKVSHGNQPLFRHDAAPQAVHNLQQLSDQGSASEAVELPGGQDAVSNPFGGVNADMASLTLHQQPSLTVTAELIAEVLGPRKHNETDSADSLVMPGV